MARLSATVVLLGLVASCGMARAEQEVPRPELPKVLGVDKSDPSFPSPLQLFSMDPLATLPREPALVAEQGAATPTYQGEPLSPDNPAMIRTHYRYFPQVWGVTGVTLFASGNKMAPNGMTYLPFGSVNFDLNIGLLPRKRLYLFTVGSFWAQKATQGVTNPNQGFIDFSKRQMDLLVGAAWNYWDFFEARVWAYSYNNLNRGMELDKPYGYNDGVVVENRYYIPKSNLFDLPRLNFLSLGYYTSKDLTDANGVYFNPGLFARAYLTYEFVPRRYYVYADSEMICRRPVNPKLLFFDDGFAARPFPRLEGLEFRAGVFNTVDVQVDNVRTLLYLTAQVIF